MIINGLYINHNINQKAPQTLEFEALNGIFGVAKIIKMKSC